MSSNGERGKRFVVGCLIVCLILMVMIGATVLTGAYFMNRAFSDFDSFRDQLKIRSELSVADEKLRFSPGIDSALWCRFTVDVDSIAQVFEKSEIDTSEFSNESFEFKVDWINDSWWDVQGHEFTGGEYISGEHVWRVGYFKNADGTLTVYIFWFEV